MPEEYIDHDTWNYSPSKLPKASALHLEEIHGVLPFDGVRNPGFRSSTAHIVWFTYKSVANEGQPKVAICESATEAAVGIEALIATNTNDVRFQPLTVKYNIDGRAREYTHDLLVVYKCGHRRLVFVRNAESLTKPKTWREIAAIGEATPPQAANDMIVVNADDYSRQRRENLFRMHQPVQEVDHEADDLVLSTTKNLKSLWQMKDIFPHVPLPQWRVLGPVIA